MILKSNKLGLKEHQTFKEKWKIPTFFPFFDSLNPSLVNAPAWARWKSTPLMFMRPNAPAG